MWKQAKNGVVRVGGIILALAGILPDNGLPLIGQIVNGASSHPVRAALVVVGVALILYSFKTQILDAFGIRTLKRVENDVRAWLDAFSFSVKREPNKDAHFEFIATPELGPAMVIGNYRELDRYVIIQGQVKLSDADKKFFDGLSADEQGALGGNLGIYMSRSRASFKIDLRTNEVLIQRRVPITADLSEHLFVTAIEDFINARTGALNALVLLLRSARKEQALSVLVPVPIGDQEAKGDESR